MGQTHQQRLRRKRKRFNGMADLFDFQIVYKFIIRDAVRPEYYKRVKVEQAAAADHQENKTELPFGFGASKLVCEKCYFEINELNLNHR
jgi:hypothetical protein